MIVDNITFVKVLYLLLGLRVEYYFFLKKKFFFFQEDTVSKQVQKALRRHQLQTHYKAHEPKPVQQTREEKRAKAKANRYKIVNSNRALPADSADTEGLSDSEGDESQGAHLTDQKERQKVTVKTSQSVAGHSVSGSNSEAGGSSEASPSTSSSDNSVGQLNGASPASDGSMVHVFDVEQDSTGTRSSTSQPSAQSGSGITLNGENLTSQPALAVPESSYVYDLYYINNNNQQYNFRDLENILSIEALHDELVTENDRDVECDQVYDDEDDSNDESNWRNDYPDDDPDNSDDEFDPGEFLKSCSCVFNTVTPVSRV